MMTPQDVQATANVLCRVTVAFSAAYTRIMGSSAAGMWLSQSKYWSEDAKTKNSASDGWFTRTQAEWEYATGLGRWEQETARKKLRDARILTEHRTANPTRLWFHINWDIINGLLLKEIEAEKKRNLAPVPPSNSDAFIGFPVCRNTTKPDDGSPDDQMMEYHILYDDGSPDDQMMDYHIPYRDSLSKEESPKEVLESVSLEKVNAREKTRAAPPSNANGVDLDSAFGQWWDTYPKGRKGSRSVAREKFAKVVKKGKASAQQLIEAVGRYRQACDECAEATGTKTYAFVKMPETWLNQRMWEAEDLPQPDQKTSSRGPSDERPLHERYPNMFGREASV